MILKFIEKWSLFFLIVWLLLLISLALWPFLTFEKLLLFNDIALDSYTTFFSYLCLFNKYIQGKEIPTWSFYDGLGGDVSTLFTYTVPLSPLLFLNTKGMLMALPYYYSILLLVTGIIFYWYLKFWQLNNISRIIGATCFTFSGFLIAQISMAAFIMVAVIPFLLMLIANELAIQNQKKIYSSFLIFALCILIGILHSFTFLIFFYVTGLISFFYQLIRNFGIYGKIKEALIHSIRNVSYLLVCEAIGILLCGPILMMWLTAVSESVRTPQLETNLKNLIFGDQDFMCTIQSFLTRLYSRDIQGHFLPKDKGARLLYECYNFYEAPHWYSTIFALIFLIPGILFAKKFLRKQFILFIILGILLVIFNIFRKIFWFGFEGYFRELNYFFSISIILPAIYGFEHFYNNPKKNQIWGFISGVFFLLLLIIAINIKQDIFIDKKIMTTSVIFLLTYSVICLFSTNIKSGYRTIIFLLTLAIECIIFTRNSLVRYYREIPHQQDLKKPMKDKHMEGYDPNNMANCSFVYPEDNEPCFRGTFRGQDIDLAIKFDSNLVKCVEFVKKKEDNNFFRITNNVRMYFNENKIIGYYTTTTYRQMNSKFLVNYLLGFDYMQEIELTAAYRARWIRGFAVRNFIGDILNHVYYNVLPQSVWLKYKNNLIGIYDSVFTWGKAILLANRFRLPFGYAYTKYISEEEFKKLNPTEKDYVALFAIVLNSNNYPHMSSKLDKFMPPPDTILKNWNYDLRIVIPALQELSKHHLKINKFSDTHIAGEIQIDKPSIIYLSFPYSPNWKLWINGKEDTLRIVNFGMSGIFLDKGKHHIELKYKPIYFTIGIYPSILGLFLLCGMAFWIAKQRKKIKEHN